ncbi:MFS transporter [Phycicoccus sp. HDW14]|nr:MFS transporter [Phycicoccus sp. HDW14]
MRLVDTSAYGWQLAGQLLASVAQPLVLTATTTLAARCFPPGERTVAIAVGSAAQFVGVLGGALGGAPLVAAGGLPLLLGTHAVLAGVAAVALLVMLRVAVVAPVAQRDAHGLRWLRHEPLLWRLSGLLFVGVGVFNALATWLDPVLAGLGHPGAGGPLIAVTTLAGVLGAAVLPGPVAARGLRRRLLVAATAATGLVFAVLVVVHTPVAAGVLLAGLGFLLLAGLPVALEWSEAHVGVARSGTATAVLLLAGNLGGVLLVLLVQPFVGSPRLALGSSPSRRCRASPSRSRCPAVRTPGPRGTGRCPRCGRARRDAAARAARRARSGRGPGRAPSPAAGRASAGAGPGRPSAAPRARSGCRGRAPRASRRAGPGRCAARRRTACRP